MEVQPVDAKIYQLKKWVAESDNIVFFGGARSQHRERDTGFPQR